MTTAHGGSDSGEGGDVGQSACLCGKCTTQYVRAQHAATEAIKVMSRGESIAVSDILAVAAILIGTAAFSPGIDFVEYMRRVAGACRALPVALHALGLPAPRKVGVS